MKLVRRDDRPNHFADVSVGTQVRRGGAIDERLRWSVGHEPDRDFSRDMARRSRMAGKDIENLFAILDPAVGAEALTEHHLLAGIMHLGPEDEPASARGETNGPPSEGTRHVDDIFLGVSAVHSYGVQLQKLATVVLVESALSPALPDHGAQSRPAGVYHAARVVEIEKHRGTSRDGPQEIAELSERP